MKSPPLIVKKFSKEVRNIKNIFVVKKDGVLEIWSTDKLVTSIAKTGIELDRAEVVSVKIEEWVKESAEDGKIDSTTVKDKVIEALKDEDPAASDSYRAYKG